MTKESSDFQRTRNISTLAAYLDSFMENPESTSFPRRKCCGTSRSLYCPQCCELLIEKYRWPLPLQRGNLDLPFALDIILSDNRQQATGFHAYVLLKASHGSVYCSNSNSIKENGERKDENKAATTTTTSSSSLQKVRLFDTKNGRDAPCYYDDDDNTFVLFPSEKSVPLSSVSDTIKRLVVLDCKWTKSAGEQRSPSIDNLPQVHLDNPPLESFFWRWHNAGQGMCSTLEAIYFAALEVLQMKTKGDDKFEESSRDALIHLMWLFGIIRAATVSTAARHGKPLPFTKEGKELQQLLRRTEKGSEKHLRDIERGCNLKDELKQERMRKK
mmetsp:Transcript_21460/g.31584  ORF Transcript_21460/g.31584 Transcript_21460/m.31584 type:complete len:329 (-) Transcript_21460:385-1371(-)